MDFTSLLKFAKQAALAGQIRDVHYASLTPEQRSAIEQSLTYFDYFQGYDPTDTEDDKKKKFDAAVASFVDDNKLANLSPIQQFLTILFDFLGANGADVSGLASFLPDGGAPNPSGSWSRSTGPVAGQPVALPAQVNAGELGTTLAPPAGSADKSGRYRLMTVATAARGNSTRTEMVVVDPTGKVVWRNEMNSGSSTLYSLPGLRSSFDGKPITTEYKIDWDDVRLNRRDALAMRGMSYSNGEPGFSFSLENPDNLAALGGAGRSGFRIHPGGRTVGTAGCLEFTDANGQIDANSDRAARSFADLMTSLPASQRPVSLEILNGRMLGKHVDVAIAPEKSAPHTKPHPTKVSAHPHAPAPTPTVQEQVASLAIATKLQVEQAVHGTKTAMANVSTTIGSYLPAFMRG